MSAAHAAAASSQASRLVFGWQQGWRYGLMGLPLAFVALPLYVVLPNYYAREFGVPLATLGAVLLGARLFDAFIDPLLGRWSDRLYARSKTGVLAWAALAAVMLGVGFTLLFFPPVRDLSALVIWATACLMLTYAAYSALSILHQTWGAMLGGDEAQHVVCQRAGGDGDHGTPTPTSAATRRTASGNETPRVFITKRKTSPDSLQPKQRYLPWSGRTLKLGVFSS